MHWVNFQTVIFLFFVSDKITDAVLGQIMDKNWKIRKEGLETVSSHGFDQDILYI